MSIPARTAWNQREITGLPAFAAAPRPSRRLAPRSVRIKDLYFRTDRVLRTSTGARPARPERRCQTADAPQVRVLGRGRIRLGAAVLLPEDGCLPARPYPRWP